MKLLRWLCIAGLVLGGVLVTGPLWGSALTAYSMQSAFSHLHQSGVSDPKALAVDIGHSLFASGMGFVACPLGAGLIAVSLIILLRRRPPPLPDSD